MIKYKICVLLNILIILHIALAQNVVFKFPEYDYLPSVANEKAYKDCQTACENSPRCDEYQGVAKTNCIRECISPPCYREIYEFDELEEGEVDVRLNSFKGCFVIKTKH
uniref:CSON004216 protein n=1 Tax=Culicoides sonorensis TaxID=179676 RepID=A0A336L4Q4_CULSO